MPVVSAIRQVIGIIDLNNTRIFNSVLLVIFLNINKRMIITLDNGHRVAEPAISYRRSVAFCNGPVIHVNVSIFLQHCWIQNAFDLKIQIPLFEDYAELVYLHHVISAFW